MQQQLQEIIAKATEAAESVSELTALDDIRVQYLGKKGELTLMMRLLGKLSPEEKPKAGQLINEAKQTVQTLLNSKKETLERIVLENKLAQEMVDVTLPGRSQDVGGLHPVTRTLRRIEEIFAKAGLM